jgi:aryl-alcohol dehydrogenase-like predicted oxidoreductase
MKYRRLGRSGLMVSELVLGTMNFGHKTGSPEAFSIIDASIDAGINLIDCADVYSDGEGERILGEALRGGGKRKSVFLTSKVFLRTGEGPNDAGNSRHHILEACENSLKRLKTDYIDIYFLHRTDFNVPQEETLAALDMLVQQGKIRYVGCSTHPAWRVVEAMWLADKHRYPKFICEQPPYNLLDRRVEMEVVPMCREYDLGIICWSPLAQGLLAGRYSTADRFPDGSRATEKAIFAERITADGIKTAARLNTLALRKSCPLTQLALAWILRQPGVTGTIIGPRTLSHLEEMLPACDLELDESDLAFCDTLVPPGGFVSDHFNTAGWNPPL